MTLSLAESLAALPEDQRKSILADLTEEQHKELQWDWSFWGRPEQQEPPGDWNTLLVLAGRGFGKSAAGSQMIRSWACGSTPLAAGRYSRFALIAETAADARDVMVEGVSGILAAHPPDYRPLYEPSKRRLTWKNGAIGTLFNATEPDQLRGPNFDAAWLDELAKFQYSRDTWDMLQFALRIGDHPRVIVTTTPRPIPIIKELLAASSTKVVRGSTMDNRGNLAPSFLKQIQARYAGTRLGRQELNAEVLDDNPNALWTRDIIERNTVKQADVPAMTRIVVAIDPSGTKGNDEGDDIGIVAAGRGVDGKLYVMQDATVQASPAMWGAKAVKLYHELRADMIVAERNYGGAMVEHVIRTVDPTVPYKEVTASRGKWIRAEPVASLYERNLCRHVGALPQLEDEMCAFGLDGLADGKSPNRLDAMVWAATELMLQETRGAVSRMDWLDWDKPSYPQTSTVLACVRYLGNGQPPAITVWGVFVPGDARATAAPRVILLYSWTGHVHGPDLAAGLDIMCKFGERSKIETARVSKLFGLKAIPSYKVSRLLLETDGKPNAVQHELGKVLIEHDIVVEIVDAKRWGDEADRMSGVQHMFEDKMVYAPLSRRFAMQTVDNVEEFPNAANSGLASTATLALLYMRDTGMLLRSEEHGRMTTEAATFRGRQKGLYAG